MDAVSLGLVMAAGGAVLYGAVWGLLRTAARMKPGPLPPEEQQPAADLTPNTDAVLVIQSGGRVLSLNVYARQAFDLAENELPNLDRLASHTRPAEAFYRVCAGEGQAHFSVDGRLAEGSAYPLPNGAVLVTLRYVELTAGLSSEGSGSLPGQSLATFTELTRDMTASLDVDTTLSAILSSVEKMLPSDFMEITLWDVSNQVLVPYRMTGLPGVDRSLEKSAERYPAGQGYSGVLLETKQALFVPNVDARTDLRPNVDLQVIPLMSYLGVPLLAGSELVGTLELGSRQAMAFSEADLELVRLLASPAAAALRNAVAHKAEQRKAAELSGLARLTQAFGSLREPKDIYIRLVDSIASLIPVNVLGFLIYNETTHMLEAQAPFQGIPAQVFADPEWARAFIPAGSPAENILLSQDVLITENASEDRQWEELGLLNLARFASLRDTVLIPLISSGRMLGYLQASNHSDAQDSFSNDELHLLMIIANQAAPIIENATLIQVSRQRAQRAEALRRIASLASSAATLDEILKFSLLELSRLLRVEVGVILLYNEETSALELHRPSLVGFPAGSPDPQFQLHVDDPQFHFTVSGGMHPLVSKTLAEEKALLPVYRTFTELLKIESAVVVPLVVRDRGIGELWLANHSPTAFDRSDVQLLATASGQLAGVVERTSLFSQTDDSLRRRVDQLTAVTRITRELSTTLDLKYLLQTVYDEAVRTTRADCGSILLLDLNSSESGLPQITFSVGDPHPADLYDLESRVVKSGQPLLIGDFSQAGEQPGHAGVQSALLAPIVYQDRPAGLIHLHSATPHRFDETSLEFTQTLSIQAAVVLDNALQYQEQLRRGELLNRQIETLAKVFETTRALGVNQPLEQALNGIAAGITQATPFQVVLISLVRPDTGLLERVCQMGMPLAIWDELRAHRQPWRSVVQLMRPEYRFNRSYYIPSDNEPLIPEDVHLVTILPAIEKPAAGMWDPDDMLLIPLTDTEGNPLGLISLDAPSDSRRPDRPTFEALDIFAAQASLVVENQARVADLTAQADAARAEVARQAEAVQSAQAALPILLRKDLESTLETRRLSGQARRVRDGLEVSELMNRQTDADEMLRILAQELVARLGMDAALVAVSSPAGPRLSDTVGALPDGANPEALFGQRNPLRASFSSGELEWAPDLAGYPEWGENSLLKVFEARSFVCLPLQVEAQVAASILAVSRRPLADLTLEDQQVYGQVTRQASVVLQNLTLLGETRRRLEEVNRLLEFSRQIGSLDAASIMRTLVENALLVISKADAALAVSFDPKTTCLVPQAAAGYVREDELLKIRYPLTGILPGQSEPVTGQALPAQVFLRGQARRIDEVQFARDYHLPQEDLLHYRNATGGRLPVSALLLPIRSGETSLGVLILENFDLYQGFSAEDEAMAASLTRQTALALENARLYAASEERARQLHALTLVSGTISSSLQSDALISSLLSELAAVIPYETATLWLRSGEHLSISAVRGFADEEQRLGLTVAVEDSQLFNDMIRAGRSILVPDVREDARFPSLVEMERLSWLGVPLVAKGELIGAIALEKTEPDYYSPEHVQAAATFAGQAGVAIENARLYEESQRRASELAERSQRLALLNRFSAELGHSLDSEHILMLTAKELSSALGCSLVSVLEFEDGLPVLRAEVADANLLPLEEQSGTPIRLSQGDGTQVLPDSPVFTRMRETLGIFSAGEIASESELAPLAEFFASRGSRSVLALPLATGQDLAGCLLLQNRESYRFSLSEIELARTIGNQAAIAMQNARLFGETRRLTEELEGRVQERTAELTREHHSTETLLRITTELSASLDMGQVLSRTLTVLNEATGAEASAILLDRGGHMEIYHRAGLDLDPTAQPASGNGRQPRRPEESIAAWVTKLRQAAFIPDLASDPRWNNDDPTRIPYRSVIAVPLILGEEVLGSLQLYHRVDGQFASHQMDLVEAAARQISITINNAELFNLIRDQSERLGGMLREQQIEASRSRAILEAVADGVLVTDASNRITLFNASASKILRLRSDQVLGQSMDQFGGLFGQSVMTWMSTIRDWTRQPGQHQTGDTYSERVTLENGTVVSIHLAPVIWRSDFLGTVSIFRDITSDVKVDRIKSEFVANVSHELRTPMTSIKGYVEILLMGAAGSLSDQQTHFLRIVRNNTERLGVLVNDLLDMSRIETGRVTLSLQTLDLKELAGDAMAEIERRSREEGKPITFRLDAPANLPKIEGDQERIRQVLLNLVSNGYNYTPAGGQVTVSMRPLDTPGEAVQVDVSDNGIGILPEDQERIFERFYRGEDPLVLATAGTGLGLSIVKILVEMHRGRLWFHSSGTRGEGSVFSFTLPHQQLEE